MKMSVIHENNMYNHDSQGSSGVTGDRRYPPVNRDKLARAYVLLVRNNARDVWDRHTKKNGPEEMIDHIGEVFDSLPTQDVLDLGYAVQSMGGEAATRMFLKLRYEMCMLRKQINEVCAPILEEEEK